MCDIYLSLVTSTVLQSRKEYYPFPHRELLLLLFSHEVMSDSLQPQGLQHFRLPWLSLSPRGCSNSRLLSHPTISSSPPLLLMLSIFSSIRVFSSELALQSGGQSMGASASVLSINIQGWFPLALTASRDARVKYLPTNAGERCEFHLMVRRITWKRAWLPFQYSCLEKPMDRGAWEAVVHRVVERWTWLKRLSTHS